MRDWGDSNTPVTLSLLRSNAAGSRGGLRVIGACAGGIAIGQKGGVSWRGCSAGGCCDGPRGKWYSQKGQVIVKAMQILVWMWEQKRKGTGEDWGFLNLSPCKTGSTC